MGKYKIGDILVWLSVLAAVVAGYDSLAKSDVFGLAGTQWMLIAIILGIYALYFRAKMS